MLPDIMSLALFAQVAETHSITKAAAASHIAVAAASRRMVLLEHQLGLPLMERTARGTELTPAGRAVLYHARQILSHANQMVATVTEYAAGLDGHVRIQASASATSQFLPGDLAAFARSAPHVVIALEERSSGEIAQALREGTTDVGVVMEGTPMEGLQKFEYNIDRLVAVVPRDHCLRGRSVSFSTMLDFDFVGMDNSTAISRLLADQAAVAQKNLRLRVQVKSFAALCKMIESGLGIGAMPDGAARPFLAAMKLRAIRLSDPWATRRMYVCVRGDYQCLPPAARRLVDHLVGTPRGRPPAG